MVPRDEQLGVQISQLPNPSDPRAREHLLQTDSLTKLSVAERIVLYQAFDPGYDQYKKADVRKQLASCGFVVFKDEDWHFVGGILQ